MRKQWIIFVSLMVSTALVLFFVSTTSQITGGEIIEPDHYKTYFDEMGLDSSNFTASQMKRYVENDVEFIKEFDYSDYIAPSAQNGWFDFGGYSRDWNISSMVDYDNKSTIEPKAYLFKKRNTYYILITFVIPYHRGLPQNNLGYIDFGFSNNFDMDAQNAITVVYKGTEYQFEAGNIRFEQDTTQFRIPENSSSLGDLKFPELIYSYFITLSPNEDNDLENDMFLSVDLDFYMQKNESQESVILGFSEFKANQAREIYLVSRKSVQYKGGNNQ